jgi:type II secretory pathway component GspD/PulD (secretin)
MRGGLPPRGAEELKVFVLKHAKAQELVPVVERIFRTADFTAEIRTNQLIVRGNSETLKEVTALLEKLDVELPRR